MMSIYQTIAIVMFIFAAFGIWAMVKLWPYRKDLFDGRFRSFHAPHIPKEPK